MSRTSTSAASSATRKQPGTPARSQTVSRAESGQRLVVLALFFISGGTALAYQVVWVRLLTLIFGATTLSVGTVLSCYMAGLAGGSWFWSRRADQTARPLRFYATLEVGVALFALASPALFDGLRGVYRALFAGGVSDFSALSAVRFLLCLPALVLPTFLMGGTLPVLARFCTRNLDRIGRGVGDLYAFNTFGAVVGTVLTGFVIIPFLGVRGTLYAAVALNLALAAFAFALSTRWERDATAPEPAIEPGTGVDSPAPLVELSTIRLVLIGFALSGFAAMIYEVAWTRALVQIFGNSTYAFTTMLAAFLIGLAAGAALAGRFADRAQHPVWTFALLQLLIGGWAAAATPLIEWLPPLFLRAFQATGGAFVQLQIIQFVVCCALMLPTTLALGAVYPIVSKIYVQRAQGAGTGAGVPYAWNTFGTIFGALLAGFVFLPRLGIEWSIALGTLLNLAVWGLLAGRARTRTIKPELVWGLGALVLLAVGRLAFMPLDARTMSAGVYMYPEYFVTAQQNNSDFQQTIERQRVLWHREGYTSSLAVLSVGHDLVLNANGKTDASTGDLSTQRVLAHLPLLLRPNAKKVLVVGLASGCTVGSALLHPISRLDCIEIEPAMYEAAGFFARWNHNALADPRLRIHWQDARNYMAMTRDTYDVLTAEPTNPWIAGVNNLFTREYFQDCEKRLAPGGLMCQWFPAYNFDSDELRTALGTFRSVFPHVLVFAFPHQRTDFFAIGTREPLSIDPLRLAHELTGTAGADMRVVEAADLWHLAGGLVLDDAAVNRLCEGTPLNTDERPRLEFSTPRHFYRANSEMLAVMNNAYSSGLDSVLEARPDEGPGLLHLLGATLPPGTRVTQAVLAPQHPKVLALNVPQRDVAELRLEVSSPQGGATLRALPPPRATWPESMDTAWQLDRATGNSTASADGTFRAVANVPGTQAAFIWEGSSAATVRRLAAATRPAR